LSVLQIVVAPPDRATPDEDSIPVFLCFNFLTQRPTATNVAQTIISGTRRFTPGAMSMPAFGSTYTDTEIAAVANYVTGRFGSVASKLTAKDVAELRGQTGH
jgi:hypothetical protein